MNGYNVTELDSYREQKEDKLLDERMVEAQNALGDLIENVDCDSATLFFVWRNLNDILLERHQSLASLQILSTQLLSVLMFSFRYPTYFQQDKRIFCLLYFLFLRILC